MLVIFPGNHPHELAGDVKGSNYSLSIVVPGDAGTCPIPGSF